MTLRDLRMDRNRRALRQILFRGQRGARSARKRALPRPTIALDTDLP
jgi:hypothetical protein